MIPEALTPTTTCPPPAASSCTAAARRRWVGRWGSDEGHPALSHRVDHSPPPTVPQRLSPAIPTHSPEGSVDSGPQALRSSGSTSQAACTLLG